MSLKLEHKNIINNEVQKLVSLLIKGDFDKIVAKNQNGELQIEQIQDAINEYGGILTFANYEDYHTADICPLGVDEKGNSDEYVVLYDLWIDDEKSDLTLQMVVNVVETTVEIFGIRVM